MQNEVVKSTIVHWALLMSVYGDWNSEPTWPATFFLFSSSSSLTKFSTIVIVMTITTAAKIHQKTSSLTSCWILLSWQFISCVTRAPVLLLRSWVALSVSQSVCEGSVTPDQIFNKSRSPFSIENAKLWPVFADCGYFVTNLRTFLGPFYRPR